MEKAVTESNVVSFLKDIIELGDIHTIDDSPDKYIRSKVTGQEEVFTVDGANKPLAIYGTAAADAVIVNPFAEGEASSAKAKWFYISRQMILNGILIKIMKTLLKIGSENHNKKKGEKESPDLRAVKYLSNHILEVDEKMCKEFDQISKKLDDFMVIHYNTSTRQGEVKCIIFTEAQKQAFKSFRAKTWEIFEGLMLDILNVKDLSEFNYQPKTVGIPVFESFVNILVTIYEKIQEPAKIVGIELPQLVSLRSHLKYLDQYYGIAQWCKSSVGATVPNPKDMQGNVPWNNAGLPQMTTIPAMPMAPVPMLPQPAMMPVQMPMQMGQPMPMYNQQMPVMAAPIVGVQNPAVPNVFVESTTKTPPSPGNGSGNPFARP